ncbi:MAG: NAD(+)/NADH kinase [Acidobacteria bacterium]|nr:NAD(+)/NADH kinase [Acidobacteriota bacterium]
MQPVSTVGIVAKPGSTQAVSIVPDLLEWFGARHIGVRMDEQTARYAGLSGGCPRDRVADGTQLLIVLGGDGTLLAAARALEGRDIPIFAVNLGALGFLTAITVDEIFPELERALRNEHRIAARRMLQCELMRDGRIVARYDALNDVVLTKASLARMIDLETHVDAHFVATYKADGVIVATPTGSTAYSLSAGGPIIFPAVDALCITPICPHALTARPVLVPGSSNIKMINLSEDSTFLTIDGQIGEPLHHRDTIMCRASAKSVKLIRPPRQKFFDVLRSKLKWGER